MDAVGRFLRDRRPDTTNYWPKPSILTEIDFCAATGWTWTEYRRCPPARLGEAWAVGRAGWTYAQFTAAPALVVAEWANALSLRAAADAGQLTETRELARPTE